MLTVLFSLCLGWIHGVVQELVDAFWLVLGVCNHIQSSCHLRKDVHECANIIYIAPVIDYDGWKIPVE